MITGSIPKWVVFFWGQKNCHLAIKKRRGPATCKKAFFWEKKAYHILKGEKKKLNSPYLDHRFFVCRQYIGVVGLTKILLFSLTFTQIWLNPGSLVKDRQSTYLTKLKKKTLKFPTRLELLPTYHT